MSRFDYVKYDELAQSDQASYKEAFERLAENVTTHMPGRAQSLILTKLEEAYMWVGKMIRDEQIARNRKTESQEEQTNKN